MNSIEKSICEAIDIIVQKAVSEAQYDKTVQATVVTCVDVETGKYKIKYQDSIFYAYSNNIETTYPDGAGVYILIPGNDMSKLKTILGTAQKLGINYIPTVDESDSYEVNGNNCITSLNSFGLCSYRKGSYVKVLYHKDYSESQNLIKLNKTAVDQYIKESGTIICGGVIRTELNREQQYRGNYGIIFALDFLDNSTGATITKYYTIDIDKMVGNPYKLVTDTRQYGIFDIDNINFQRVNYISIFTNNFPNSKPDNQLVDDIFISNIELCGAIKLSDDDISNYNLSIITPQGTYFDNTSLSTDTRSLQAQVRIKGKVIDNTSKNLSFYWFIEHVGIGYQSLYYNKYGGRGWKCLNEYTIIKPAEEDEQAVVNWIPATYRLDIKKSDVVAKEARYKCVAIYDQSVMSKIITIKNLDSSYDITIESDSGDQFYFDIGFPTLTCKVNGIEHPEYTYSWAVTDNAGDFQTIAETPDLNQAYQTAYDNYENLLDQIKKEAVPEVSNKAKLEQFEQNLKNYDTITRVDKNKIYKINVNTITTFSTYSCTVYYNDIYLGTASIILKNSLEVEGAYSLIINDGSYVYKYNPDGVSPASSALETPIEIKALTFDVYNNLGQKIDDEIIKHCEIKWIIPTEDTLLKVPSSYSPSAVDLINNTATYSNLMSFSYLINDKYNIDKKRNNIQLQVTYKSMTLIATTDLTFVKEGESGTNGTDFICRIVPNVPSGATPPMYPILTQLPSGSWSLNYSLVSSNRFFRAQLWHNENKILDSVTSTNSSEGKPASITWSILKNKYTSSLYDYTSLSVDAITGIFNFSGYSYNSPANIVKVTIEYDGVTYYATIPVITVKVTNSNYRVTLKDNTGFMYAIYTSDGQDPQYDNVNPFELVVTQNVGSNQWEDITKKTTSQYAVTYNWNYLGQIYNNGWIQSINLTDRYGENPPAYQKVAKPLDNYDGLCVTNAIEAIVYKSGTEVVRIHIPIHLYLNRFGNSAINGWDGNSVSIDEQGGVILSPQIGAGVKDSNNRFTGAIMGKVKEAGKTSTEVGLFGYNAGERTFKLSAEDGSAEFGKNNGGKIIIDPSQNRALLYSGNYSTSKKTGLMIDLTTPEIRYGSGAFVVDKNGHLTAKGGGSIAGWNIDDDSLFTGVKTSSTNTRISSVNFSRAINGTQRNNLRIALGSKFAVAEDGTMYASDAVIKGEIHATKGYIGNETTGWIIESNNIRNRKTSATDEINKGIYLGTSRIAFGAGNSAYSYFNSDGTFSLAGGKIKFSNNVLNLDNISLNWENTKIRSDGTTLQSQFTITEQTIESNVSKTYETKEDASGKLTEAKEYASSQIKQTAESITSTVSKTYETKEDASGKLTEAKEYASSQIKQTAESITSTVSKTYETKEDASGKLTEANGYTDEKLKNYSTTLQMQSAIDQKADSITLSVSKTYETKSDASDKLTSANAHADGIKTTLESSISTIKQTADSISTEVKTKVDEKEIISKINQSAESITIAASKININGVLSVNGTFQVNSSGNMIATGGTIGGFTITKDKLYAGSSTRGYVAIQAGTQKTSGAFAAGMTNWSNWGDANFKVTMGGKMIAKNAEITGTIESTNIDSDGHEYGVRIGNGRIAFKFNGSYSDWIEQDSGIFTLKANTLFFNASTICVYASGGRMDAVSGTVTFGSNQQKWLTFVNGICVGGSLS